MLVSHFELYAGIPSNAPSVCFVKFVHNEYILFIYSLRGASPRVLQRLYILIINYKDSTLRYKASANDF